MKTRPIKVRPWAGFRTSLPSDAVETYSDIIQVGGKTVAREIGKILDRLGARTDEPVLEGDNGWQFNVDHARRTMMCQVAQMETVQFLFYDKPMIGWFHKRPNQAYVDLLTRLAEELDRDPRFWDIRWYDDGGDAIRVHDEPGSPRPVG